MQTYISLNNNNFAITSCDFFHGFRVSAQKQIKGNLCLNNLISLRPSITSVQNRIFTKEPKHTASYNGILSYTYGDIPIQLSISTESLPSVSFVIPINEDVSFSNEIGVDNVNISGKIAKERYCIDLNLNSDYQSISGSLFGSLMVNRSFSFGFCYDLSNFEVLVEKKVNSNKKVCICVNRNLIATVLNYEIHPKTTVGTSLSLNLNDLNSDFKFGFKRMFKMSSIHVTVTDKLVVKSLYQFNIKDGLVFEVSSFSDHFNQMYSVGAGIYIDM